ncbi:hypothetical protein JRI60_07165 [Archangium violaceum]|uniref:carboxypeptidase-like regulatory domain-containing protein n=1 Tax=Archangium violaceum TaxID=83451 RepID=UPI0019510A9A|nr:carboxypeptidase-like regulatory domain-containing protein [Archangium violaceum]QRN98803.1 hypothetical protein JRI60_07165 [Archangium violaceum]
MNRSKIALAVSVALLTLWAVPAEAQRPSGARQRTGSAKTAAVKQSGAKSRSRVKPKPDAVEPPAAEPPIAELPAAEPPVAAQPSTLDAPTADTAAEPLRERPWAKGVPKEKQDSALELFREGNTLLKESVFVPAADKYRKALALWDHPAIHYNLALVLMNLDQPIEVHEHLVAALRYGPDPLEKEKFEYARNYKTLIEKQLARVDITCETPGATVTMDGQTLFTGPGRYAGLVRPGAHSIVATLQGYATTDQSRTLLPGETTTLDMKMLKADELIRYRRRWAAPMPWLVMGAGVAAAAGSAWVHLQARDNIDAFSAGITECGGCKPTPDLASTLSRGNLLQNAAIGGYAVGGAALITGAVLVYLNQPQPYRIDDPSQPVEKEKVSVTPLLGGGSGGVLATFRF